MFLTDSQLNDLLDVDPAIIAGLRRTESRFDADASVQPASIDLTIGEIFEPAADAGQLGSPERPRHELSLESGQTAFVTTKEHCNLPGDIGGIGFPPSTVSSKGLLMTNPGHVDPGYSGPMRFTVINMAREAYNLGSGDRIVTLLLFRLAQSAHQDYSERRPDSDGSEATVDPEVLDRLSPDFLDVSRRAQAAAADAERRTRLYAVLAPVLLSVLALLAGLIFVIVPLLDQQDETDALAREVAALSASPSDRPDSRVDARIRKLEQAVAELRAQQ